MDHYLRGVDILGFNDDYVDLVENVDQMVRDAEGHDDYSDGEFANSRNWCETQRHNFILIVRRNIRCCLRCLRFCN